MGPVQDVSCFKKCILASTYRCRDVIRCALSADTKENLERWKFKRARAEGTGERFQNFQTLGIFLDDNVDFRLRLGHGCWVVRKVTGNKSISRKVLANWRSELERFSGGKSNTV